MEPEFERNLSPEEYLQCGICNEQATKPKLLMCLHTFCEDCLQPMCEDQSIKCPICDQLTEGDVCSFKDNILVANIRSKLEKQQEIRQSSELLCGVCKSSNPVAFLCLQCDMFLCGGCFQKHGILLQNHHKQTEPVEKLKNLNSEDFLKLLRRPKEQFCQNHDEKTEQISAYCITCSICLCLNCVVLEHKGHAYHSIKKEAATRRKELTDIKATVEANGKKFIKIQEDLKQLVDNLLKSKYKVTDLIQGKASEAIQKIKEEEEKLLGKLDEMYGGKAKVLEENLNKTKNVLERVTAGNKLVEQMMNFATDHEVLDLQETINSALSGLLREVPPNVFVEDMSIEFEECWSDSQRFLGKLIVKKQETTASTSMPLRTEQQQAAVHTVQQAAVHTVQQAAVHTVQQAAVHTEDKEMTICEEGRDLIVNPQTWNSVPFNVTKASHIQVQSPVAKANSDCTFSLRSPQENCQKRKCHEDGESLSIRKKHKKTQVKPEFREESQGHSTASFSQNNPHNPSCSKASTYLVPMSSGNHFSTKETRNIEYIAEEILIESEDSD